MSVSSGLPRVGVWTIETGVPGDGSVAAFDRLARATVALFVAAFGDLVRVASATADLMWCAPDGHVTRVEEAVSVPVDETGGVLVPADVSLVTGVIVQCALRVPTESGPTWYGEGAQFSYSCVVEYDDEDRVRPVDSSVSVLVSVDCWSGPAGSDNRARLAEALREWEGRTGRPIAEWYSSIHRTQVSRYGFDQS